MTISMFQAAVPPSLQMMDALSGILAKAAAHAEARKIKPEVLLGCRLFPDMFAFARQVQVAADFAKGGCARLAGVPSPVFEDTETSFAELQGRLDRTAAFIGTLTPDQIDGSETREIAIKVAGRPVQFQGLPYLLQFVLPNLYFHSASAFGILRHNGVEIGKRDYIGITPNLA